MLSSGRAVARVKCCRHQVLALPRCVPIQKAVVCDVYSQRNLSVQPPTPGHVEKTVGRTSEPVSQVYNEPPNPPPPPPRKKKGIFGKIVGLTLVGATGIVGYAWLDHEFRNILKEKVPYSQDVMDAVFVYLPDSPAIPAPFISGKSKPISTKDDQQLLPKLKEEVVKLVEPVKELTLKEIAQMEKEERDANNAALNSAMEQILTDLGQECESVVTENSSRQQNVIEATQKHINMMEKAVEGANEPEEVEQLWQEVSTAYLEKMEAVEDADTVLVQARGHLEKFRFAIEDGKQNTDTKKNKSLGVAKKKLDQLQKELNAKQKEVDKMEAQAKSMSWYRDLLDVAKVNMKHEIAGLTTRKEGKMTADDWKLLYGHSHKRLEQLQKELAEIKAFGELKMQTDLDIMKAEHELDTHTQVENEREKLTEKMERERQKWAEKESDLLSQHVRQMTAYSRRLDEEFDHELHLRLVEERQVFEGELSGWTARQRGIESALEARAENESVAKQAQDLWLATVALNGAILTGNEAGKTWEEQLQPLEKEVDVLFNACNNNPFVCLILETIPKTALTRGVYTEDNLKRRFRKVSRVASRVALIDETGGSLFKFMLSYMQSFFVFTSVTATEENDKINLADMDTFQLISNAQYWMGKGNLEQALKFLNQLRGEPRRAAADWIAEARLLLETKQAAQTLMAFASSTGLGTVF